MTLTLPPVRKSGARRAVVGGRAGRGARFDLAEELRVIGDGGEVERAIDLQHARAVAVGVERRQRDRLAAGEGVGFVGRGAHVEHVGVERVGGVDVQVAEVEVALRVVVGAGRARLDVDRRAAAGDAEGDGEREREEGGDAREQPARTRPSRCA